MKVRLKIAIGILIALGLAVIFRLLIGDSVVALFEPRGVIASRERDVILKTVLVMLSAAMPTVVAVLFLAWRYRAGSAKAAYEPERTGGAWSELAMWAIPAAVVAVLWVVTWQSTHALDPFKPIASDASELTVQVVALPWKWLFIYPEQGIASVNLVVLPVDAPVHFELTADAPVSSFWIPQLGSQIYAMASMKTQLNLMATAPGEYPGRNMEINGDGYSRMNFTARAVSRAEFDDWARTAKASTGVLDDAAYASLASPSQDVPPITYASVKRGLFDEIMTKYMGPSMDGPAMAAPDAATPGVSGMEHPL